MDSQLFKFILLVAVAFFVYREIKSNRNKWIQNLKKHFGGATKEGLPYNKKDYLISKAEKEFYFLLHELVGSKYFVFPQIRLSDLLWISKSRKDWRHYWAMIQQKHVDFVICDIDNLRPLLAIELDDSSHKLERRKKRDAFVDKVFKTANLPILHVKCRSNYNSEELHNIIESMIEV